jgi:hypothetical protein
MSFKKKSPNKKTGSEKLNKSIRKRVASSDNSKTPSSGHTAKTKMKETKRGKSQ